MEFSPSRRGKGEGEGEGKGRGWALDRANGRIKVQRGGNQRFLFICRSESGGSFRGVLESILGTRTSGTSALIYIPRAPRLASPPPFLSPLSASLGGVDDPSMMRPSPPLLLRFRATFSKGRNEIFPSSLGLVIMIGRGSRRRRRKRRRERWWKFCCLKVDEIFVSA